MRNRSTFICWCIISVAASALLAGVHGAAQTRPAKGQAPATAAAPAAPALSEKDFAVLQDQFINLLRQSPKLTSVVARDPSLLSNQEYVAANNPQLADFLALHPEVARNPDYLSNTRGSSRCSRIASAWSQRDVSVRARPCRVLSEDSLRCEARATAPRCVYYTASLFPNFRVSNGAKGSHGPIKLSHGRERIIAGLRSERIKQLDLSRWLNQFSRSPHIS